MEEKCRIIYLFFNKNIPITEYKKTYVPFLPLNACMFRHKCMYVLTQVLEVYTVLLEMTKYMTNVSYFVPKGWKSNTAYKINQAKEDDEKEAK